MRAALAIPLVLVGCAAFQGHDGVKMSDQDKVTCKRDGCTVWSEAELMSLIKAAMERGVEIGRQAAKGDI